MYKTQIANVGKLFMKNFYTTVSLFFFWLKTILKFIPTGNTASTNFNEKWRKHIIFLSYLLVLLGQEKIVTDMFLVVQVL